MNKLAWISLAAAVALAAGCATKKETTKLEPMAECVFPGTKDAAPLWVCDAPVDGVAVSSMGSYEKSAAGQGFMKDQATAAARVRLAQQMRVHVTNMVKQYVEATGAASSETVDRVNTNVSKLITQETIGGSRVFRSVFDSKGTVYVLVGLDPKLAEEQTKMALQTSMRNERAMWQQFKAKNGQDELAAEIAKMQPK